MEITGDILSFDKKHSVFHAEGMVEIKQENLHVKADKVTYNLKTKVITATGNVNIEQNGDIIKCNKITLNLTNNTGKMDKGEIFVKKRNFRIIGDSIEKDSSGKYILKNVTLTSCPKKEPLWAFKCKEATITPEGIAKAKKIKFKFNFLPYSLLYLPSASFPAQANRASGFLTPYFNISGKLGYRYRQSYFWAINKSSDATFYYDLMSKRGVKVGTEYRYFLTDKGKGTIKGYFLKDAGLKRKDYAIFQDQSKRYFLNFQHEQNFDNNFKIYTNLNLVSDINYKEDFSEDFKNTNFLTHKAITSENSINSIFAINKRIDLLNLTGTMEYFKDLTKVSNRQTSQKLPEITAFVSQNDYIGKKFYNMLDFEYLNIYRKEGDSFSRLIFKPTFSKPVHIKNYLITGNELSPTFAEYFFDVNNNALGNKNKFFAQFRHYGRTQIAKVYDFPYFGIIKFKHIIEPIYEYEYITETDDVFKNFAHFDYLDDEISKNVLKYGFKQRIIARFEDGSYREMMNWELYQNWQVDKKEYFFNGRNYSNIYSDLKLNLWKFFALENDLEYDPYKNYLNKFAVWGNINIFDRTFFNFEYRYLKNEIDQYNIGYNIHFLNKFDFYNYLNYDIKVSSFSSIIYGLRYSPQCLTVDFNVTEEHDPYNLSIKFLLNFHGLGSIGNL